MSLRNTTTSYGSIAKLFHWLISPLVILMLVFGYFLDNIPEAWQALAYDTHKMTGLVILALMVLRLLWTLVNPKPALPADTLPWQRSVEWAVHFMLYLFVMLMPLAGWIGSVAGGRPPHLGSFEFTLPIAPNKPLASAMFELHGNVALVLIALISVHVLAALYHHIIKRDNILKRMMP